MAGGLSGVPKSWPEGVWPDPWFEGPNGSQNRGLGGPAGGPENPGFWHFGHGKT